MAQQTQNSCVRDFAEIASASSKDAVIWYAGGRVVYANKAAEQLLGFSEVSLPGADEKAFDRFVVPIPAPEDGIVEASSQYRHPNGALISLSVCCSSLDFFEDVLTCVQAREIEHRPSTAAPEHDLSLDSTSEDIYRAIVANSFNAIILSENGVIREVNEQFMRISGYDRADLVGRKLGDLLATESAAAVENHIREKSDVVHEIRGFRKDGATIDAEVVGRSIEIDGRLFRLSAIRDISRRKQNERELLESKTQLDLAMDGGRLGTFEWNVAAGGGHVSDSLYRLFGRQPGEVNPTYNEFARQTYPDDLRRIERVFGIALTDREAVSQEIRIRWPDGETHWLDVRARFTYDGNGNALRLNGVMVDIDDKKEAQRQLQQSKSHLSIALEAGRMGTFGWDSDQRRLTMSADARRIIGVPLSLVKPASIETFFRQVNPGDRPALHQAIRRARDGNRQLTAEFRIRDENGKDRWVEVRGRFRETRKGHLNQLTGVFADIDDRKLAEAELQRAGDRQRSLDQQLAHMNRLSSVGEMASTIAHEINQPLFVVSSTASLIEHHLREQDNLSSDISRLLSVMTSQSIQAGETMRRIRGFCLNKTSQRRQTDLVEVIEGSLQLLKTELRHGSVSTATDFEGDTDVRVDPIQIQQVLVNLLRNSIEAMSDVPTADRQLSISARRVSEDLFEILVADTGPGIPADRYEAIFAPFDSTKNDGMGMGLCISRSIIEAHGGTLSLDPAREIGATFRLCLPTREEHVS